MEQKRYYLHGDLLEEKHYPVMFMDCKEGEQTYYCSMCDVFAGIKHFKPEHTKRMVFGREGVVEVDHNQKLQLDLKLWKKSKKNLRGYARPEDPPNLLIT